MKKHGYTLVLVLLLSISILIPANHSFAASNNVLISQYNYQATRTLMIGERFTPAFSYSMEGVSWTSSNSSVAVMNADGSILATGSGQTTILGTSDIVNVIIDITVLSPSIDTTSMTLYLQQQGKVSIGNYDAAASISYSSSHPSTATVDATGLVTAKKKGTAIITALVGNDRLTCVVNVKNPTLNKKKVSLPLGTTTTLKVNYGGKVTWKSKKKSIVRVSKRGKLTPVKRGTTTVKAKLNGLTLSCKVTVTKKQKVVSTSHVTSMVKLINKQRTKRGLKKLVADAKLTKAANARAKEIRQYFSHTRPDGSSCFTILPKYNITYMTCGENIAYGQPTVASVMTAWMNSPGHKASILRNTFGKVGIGRYKVGRTIYWVQLFSD